MSRRFLLSTTVLALSLGLGAARAQPVTGLYIGAAGGANFMEQEQVRAIRPAALAGLYGKSAFDTGYAVLGNAGYGFGNGVRVEVEGNYRRNDYKRGQLGNSFGGREEKYGPMVNALFDLDIGSPYIYPYIGAGAGYQWVNQRAGYIAGPLSATVRDTDSSFAYQAIAGLSFPVPWVVGLSLTAEYRYFALAGDREFDARAAAPGLSTAARIRTRGDFNHSLMLGVRYAFNVAPPAPPAAEVTPAPAAQPARTYLVFFDWDRADLTPRAQQVIAEAAKSTTRVQVTRIQVNGYTDTSGTPQYNQGLSVRRAQAVANQLVRDGVPREGISIQGYGETRLLVATGPGVREPQNRRVEIILQ